MLESDEWRFDTIPEFLDGKNTMDFFDADIEDRYTSCFQLPKFILNVIQAIILPSILNMI